VFLGAANRTFAVATIPALSIAMQIQPQFLASGDFDHDGKQDLAVANYNTKNVWILTGKGDGTFNTQVAYDTGAPPGGMAVGDLNGDGLDDLVAINSLGTMNVFVQKATGLFPTPTPSYPCHGGPAAVVLGHFTPDANLDVAVSSDSNILVTLIAGDGAGKFPVTPSSGRTTGNVPDSMATADFNRDGLDDVVTGNTVDDDCSLLLSDGSNLFGAATSLPCGVSPGAVVAGDFNGDGLPDIASANRSTPAGVVILLNTSH